MICPFEKCSLMPRKVISELLKNPGEKQSPVHKGTPHVTRSQSCPCLGAPWGWELGLIHPSLLGLTQRKSQENIHQAE